jgi:glycine/D-amino acid oxidase-like deaminating enzyme
MTTELTPRPYWWEAAQPPVLPTEPVRPASDVAIVGAGYAGLSAALVLARAGRSVQVFDRQRPGEGASSRNGGIASGNIRMGFSKMVDGLGLDRAKRIYGEGKTARRGLAAFIAEEGIDCDFELVGRFTGAVRPEHYEAQGREADFLNKHIDVGAHMVARTDQHGEIGSDLYFGGMVRPDIGGLHPAKFVAGLLAKATEAGVVVHGETPVTGVRRDGDGFDVMTAHGTVRAGDVIVATNGYTDGVDRWLRRRLVPVPSRMIATEPLAPEVMARLMPKRRMLGETLKMYHYFRPSPDGSRILFGGREGTYDDGGTAFAGHLRARLARVFPELAEVTLTHSWSGYVAFNLDFMPRLFVRDGVHYATGFCGSGVVWAWWIGQLVACRLIGEKAAESAFAGAPPGAVPFYSGRPWFLPAVLVWFGLQDRFKLLAKI